MSEQDGAQSSTKQRRSRKTNTANQQNGKQAPAVQLPTNNDTEAWKAYWNTQGQPWRTQPEIDMERQAFLAERRAIVPDVKKGIYRFKEIKLNRSDVEWLLATHNDGRGPLFFGSGNHEPYIRGLDLRGADLRFADLHRLPLSNLRGGLSAEHWLNATIEQREIAAVHLEGANLCRAILDGASLRSAHLEGADLSVARLENATLRGAHLEGTDLSHAFLNSLTSLNNADLGNKKHVFVRLVDVQWNNVNLSQVNWELVDMLGDESKAHQRTRETGEEKDKSTRLDEYQTAVRANRQLAAALQSQGLSEDAARFAYRSQLLQRKVLWYRGFRSFGQYLFSLFLDLLTGYGYKPLRSFRAYLVVIIAFATAYFVIGQTVGPVLSPLGSIVFSITSFHGRGFFPGGIALDDPLTVLAALEAFVGLLIEVTFIATLTQRLFGK